MSDVLHLGSRLTAGLAFVALAAAACSGGAATSVIASGDGNLAGTVLIAGSSTVAPISELVSEDFSSLNPQVSAPVEVTGTGGGFKDRFCAGETDINNASRQIKTSEIELCASNGITNILELKIAIDGMTVLTSRSNDTEIACLNFNEIYALVGPESSDVNTWSDANALVAELGGGHNATLPDVQLTTAGPGTESGTYDSFWELALEKTGEARGQTDKFRADWSGNNDDNVIIQGIAGNDYSFGWVGYAYFAEVADQVRALSISDASGSCIDPSAETISSGEYPLARDLYVYVNLDALEAEDGEAIEGYIDYYLSDAGSELVAEAGYVRLVDEAWDATRAAWDARTANV